jgi:hypothetical protein
LNLIENFEIDEQISPKTTFYGEDNHLEVIGFIKDCRPKEVVVLCHKCKQDPELFGEGYFRSQTFRLDAGRLPCGCSQRPISWSKEQYIIKVTRQALDVGFTFHGFSGEFIGQKTKLHLFCNKHNTAWDNTNIVNFLYSGGGGCNKCRYEKIISKKTKADVEIIEKFIKTGCFVEGTTFSRENYTKSSATWDVYCPLCDETFVSNASGLRSGSKSCNCGTYNQTKAYIHVIVDKQVPIAIKFGISNNPRRRYLEQKKASNFTVEVHSVWNFSTSSSCKRAESMCKNLSDFPCLSKSDFPNGYTETLPVFYLDRVIKTYQENGGVQI